MSPDEAIIIYAVRYALGRMSYAVHDVCEYVLSVKDVLSNSCKRNIIRDIYGYVEMCHVAGQTCGMEFDEKEWLNLAEVLRGNDDNIDM